MTEVIKEISRRYQVEIGETSSTGNSRRPYWWNFSRAFNTLEDAEAYAERISEDNKFVRIVDEAVSDAS